MALKPVLPSKTEFDALSEAEQQLYKPGENGAFVIDLEGGYVPPKKLDEFRTNNRTLYTENETLKASLKKFEGFDPEKYKDVDPDEYRALKTEKQKLVKKGVKDVDDLDAAITAAVQAATKPIVEKLTASETAAAEQRKRANSTRFRELVSTYATKAKVQQKSVRHVIREAEDVFEYDEALDDLKPRTGKRDPDDPMKDLTPSVWLQSLAKTDDYLFEPSHGTGAPGPGGNGLPVGAKELVNPSPAEMGKHAKDIASGKLVVVRR